MRRGGVDPLAAPRAGGAGSRGGQSDAPHLLLGGDVLGGGSHTRRGAFSDRGADLGRSANRQGQWRHAEACGRGASDRPARRRAHARAAFAERGIRWQLIPVAPITRPPLNDSAKAAPLMAERARTIAAETTPNG